MKLSQRQEKGLILIFVTITIPFRIETSETRSFLKRIYEEVGFLKHYLLFCILAFKL
jgi:hypothetical protein